MNENKKILIVDDTEANLITGKLLEDEGHDVIYARDYSEAVNLAGFERFPFKASGRKEDGIDMLLTDLNLPWGEDSEKPHREEGVHALGYGLVLSAMANGISYVGMITNQDHHDSPLAATWDYIPETSFRTGDTVLGIWDNRGCKAQDDCGNLDRFYKSADSFVTVPSWDKFDYEKDPLWKEVKPDKHWHEAARRLLSYES
ncbi:hypothetical protein CMI42_05640 [Candidatus Pacearchaeota archaeon]|nr:hypothetical protein [Candidatus Pacearchaeota archaeon]|tara:strand:- start:2158 stop:2760 length:603 start_codon:yes stop_codon:yes gene_type:complete